MVKLIFIGERFAGRVYELAREKTTVGRGDQNILCIHDGSISHAHCEILMNGPEVIVHDLGSANGTFVNGVRIAGQGQIKSGQTVRFGSVEARLELELPEWEDTASEESAVFAARRWERRQKLEETMPKPSTNPVTLESDTLSSYADRTVIMPVQPQSAPSASPAHPVTPPRKSPVARLVLITVAIAVAIAFSLWMIFSRK